MGIRRKYRELVIQVFYALYHVETDSHLAHLDYLSQYKEILDFVSTENNISINNNIYKLAESSIEKMIPLFDEFDDIISVGIGRDKMDKVGVIDLIIMRIAVYEIYFERIPAPVMINESVELAKKFSADKSPALINAILDKIVKNKK